MAGSIESRGNGSYRLTVSLGKGPDGKYIKKRRTVKAKNKTEAKKMLSAFVTEVESGHYIDPAKTLFQDFITDWHDKYAKKHLSPKTLENYMYVVRNFFLPAFGHMKINAIHPMHIVKYLDQLEQDGSRLDGKPGGLSPASIIYHHRVLRNIFSRAVEWAMISSNPVQNVKKPKQTQEEVEVYTQAEVQQLFQLLEQEPLHQRLIVTLAVTAGLRRGEILGLQWEDIDLDTGTITVRHSLQFNQGVGFDLKEPKTKTSARSVVLPHFVTDMLKSHQRESRKNKIKAADRWEGGKYNFVFSTWNGKPMYPSVPGTWWRRFLQRTGFKPIRFHGLRHTAATLLINQGVHAKVISERLGHADIQTTMNVYGKYIQEADQEAANKLNTLFQSHKPS